MFLKKIQYTFEVKGYKLLFMEANHRLIEYEDKDLFDSEETLRNTLFKVNQDGLGIR